MVSSAGLDHLATDGPVVDRKGAAAALACGAMIVGAPLFTTYVWASCASYRCALSGPLLDMLGAGSRMLPRPSAAGWGIFAIWCAWQLLLALVLPGRIGYGSVTPAGHRLPYRVNGLAAFALTLAVFAVAAFVWKLVPATVVYDHWGALLVTANVAGFAIALGAYVKAHRFPSRPVERYFSGSRLRDFYAGIELNPRVGALDLKVFHIGRIGMLAWPLVNLSFAAKQHEQLGYVTTSMIVVSTLQLLYVLDFFVREDWYLRTIDIQHDGFGFSFAWGGAVWVPFMYALQSFYLVQNPVDLSPSAAAGVMTLGLAGFAIFVSANRQRDRFRRSEGQCRIWGKDATSIEAHYRTLDGTPRRTQLLTSGWWGVARHVNYVGDLMMSAAFGLACGFGHVLPYFYLGYMTVLLVHRTYRDDARCREKYGRAWEDYCGTVRYRMIPGIW